MSNYINLLHAADTAGPISGHIMHPNASGNTGYFWQFATGGPALAPKATVPIGSFSGSGIAGTTYNQAQSSNATGVQMAPDKVAFMLNGYDTPLDPDPNARFWSLAYSLPGRNAFPWANGRSLHFSFTETFGMVSVGHSQVVGYTTYSVWLRDTSTGIIVNFVFASWDSRTGYNPPALHTSIAYGPANEAIPFVGGPLRNPSPIVTSNRAAFNTGAGVVGKSYARHGVMSGNNLVTIIQELRALGRSSSNPAAHALRSLSTNPAHYMLNSFNIQPELAWNGGSAPIPVHPTGGYRYLPMNLGVSYSDMSLFSYSPFSPLRAA